MLDSVHASMVLYTQEVREKQNKENKKHDARTRKESGGPRGDNSRTRSEPGGETKKKKVAGVTARLMSPRGGETEKNEGVTKNER
jgi:hypothetical protein